MDFQSNSFSEQGKFIAHQIVNSKNYVLEGIVSSVDNNLPYKVKVTLEPFGVETGWMKLSTPYIGPGYGFIFPPPPEGTPVKVIFDQGNINNGTVIAGVFNDNTQMPQNIEFGTVGIYHQSGAIIAIDNEGRITLGGTGGAAVARVGDTVTITGTDSTGRAITATGVIETGSPTVTST